MNKLEIFDATCAKVLSRLYEQFPLEIDEFRDQELELFNPQSISEENNIKREIVGNSIAFLKKNGYINYYGWGDSDTGIPKKGMVLTAKGLEKLRTSPDGIVDDGKDIGSTLTDRVKGLSNLTVDEVLKNLVKGFFTGGV
mgnify:CR=1 FL=1